MTCVNRMREQNPHQPYPRSCQECGLGPCKRTARESDDFMFRMHVRLDAILDDISAETGTPKRDIVKSAIAFLSKGAE